MIYFIQQGSGGPIKIGHTIVSVKDRLTNLQTASPAKLILLATADGSLKDEAMLHARFADDRMNGEWFSPSKKLMDYIFPTPDARPTILNVNHLIFPIEMDAIISEFEIRCIKKVLKVSGGNKKKAAGLLGMTFRSFRYRVDKHGIKKRKVVR